MSFYRKLTDKIKELIYDYGSKYGHKKGLCKALLLDSDFLVVYEHDKKVCVNGEWLKSSILDELTDPDDFYMDYIKAFQINDFSYFSDKYFKKKNRFNIVNKDDISIFSWSVVRGVIGDNYYERPGAILYFEVNYFSTFFFYSFIGEQDKFAEDYSFKEDVNALRDYIKEIDEFLGFD